MALLPVKSTGEEFAAADARRRQAADHEFLIVGVGAVNRGWAPSRDDPLGEVARVTTSDAFRRDGLRARRHHLGCTHALHALRTRTARHHRLHVPAQIGFFRWRTEPLEFDRRAGSTLVQVHGTRAGARSAPESSRAVGRAPRGTCETPFDVRPRSVTASITRARPSSEHRELVAGRTPRR